MIKFSFGLSRLAVIVLASAQVAGAAIIDGHNWADDVTDYSSKIQSSLGSNHVLLLQTSQEDNLFGSLRPWLLRRQLLRWAGLSRAAAAPPPNWPSRRR